MAVSEKQLLHDVARFYHVQTSYLDFFGKIKNSPPEAMLAVLKLLGAPVERMGDLADARRACRGIDCLRRRADQSKTSRR